MSGVHSNIFLSNARLDHAVQVYRVRHDKDLIGYNGIAIFIGLIGASV